MRAVTVYLPEKYVEELNKLVEMNYYPSISDAIRTAVRDLLEGELWSK
ncbi:CopG family transcriptional regulator [Candidatus Bathyarchaeota archaeon ex4484_205]|nr:MAG: CopG family transcriptional regulator [Candidatus Bathyarchaeota archaeon ex4484_205]